MRRPTTARGACGVRGHAKISRARNATDTLCQERKQEQMCHKEGGWGDRSAAKQKCTLDSSELT